jgi:hypothetical protein
VNWLTCRYGAEHFRLSAGDVSWFNDYAIGIDYCPLTGRAVTMQDQCISFTENDGFLDRRQLADSKRNLLPGFLSFELQFGAGGDIDRLMALEAQSILVLAHDP